MQNNFEAFEHLIYEESVHYFAWNSDDEMPIYLQCRGMCLMMPNQCLMMNEVIDDRIEDLKYSRYCNRQFRLVFII